MNSDEKDNQKFNDAAARNGLAAIIVDEISTVLSESNNNSMCRALYNSTEFSARCAEFCGTAFKRATEADGEIEYKCYAGLNCTAAIMPDKKSAVIVGRVFLKAEDYRAATERAAIGDWKQFPSGEFFGNTLFGNSSEELKNAAREILLAQHDEHGKAETPISVSEPDTSELEARAAQDERTESAAKEPFGSGDRNLENPKLSEWRSRFGAFLKSDYRQACHSIAAFIEQIYGISSSAWLERQEDRLETIFASGDLQEREIHLSVSADDEHLLEAVRGRTPLEMRERQSDGATEEPETIWLYPFAGGGEIQSALVIGGDLRNEKAKRQIERFCRKIAPQLEILRLRDELTRRSFIERAVEKFNESLNDVDSDDFWAHIINASAELMRAERSSLLVFDEKTDNFTVRAATGIRADLIKNERENLGERVAKNVLEAGKAVVVADVNKIGLRSAPEDWLYRSSSFISYPISIGKRKIGVLNLTDRADGESYNAADLHLLDVVMPSLAVMIDRADLKHQAGEFRHLSVTDELTGLRNRRYLEERLNEEIKRSNRHGFPMSFLMIDVDEFKSYNDAFGHIEGDKALQIVGACLRENLRGADVAARYGGEEFSILLPQTTTAEAEVIAERVRERVENECFPNRKITVSVGIAGCSPILNSPKDLIAAADKALYQSKDSGRNRVRIYEQMLSSVAVAGAETIENRCGGGKN
ncbi:MAG: diguanylate cyclase [Acidobacteriota bacterium]|nr:diguanylate cyclase [Acidobacteriota bacterium]